MKITIGESKKKKNLKKLKREDLEVHRVPDDLDNDCDGAYGDGYEAGREYTSEEQELDEEFATEDDYNVDPDTTIPTLEEQGRNIIPTMADSPASKSAKAKSAELAAQIRNDHRRSMKRAAVAKQHFDDVQKIKDVGAPKNIQQLSQKIKDADIKNLARQGGKSWEEFPRLHREYRPETGKFHGPEKRIPRGGDIDKFHDAVKAKEKAALEKANSPNRAKPVSTKKPGLKLRNPLAGKGTPFDASWATETAGTYDAKGLKTQFIQQGPAKALANELAEKNRVFGELYKKYGTRALGLSKQALKRILGPVGTAALVADLVEIAYRATRKAQVPLPPSQPDDSLWDKWSRIVDLGYGDERKGGFFDVITGQEQEWAPNAGYEGAEKVSKKEIKEMKIKIGNKDPILKEESEIRRYERGDWNKWPAHKSTRALLRRKQKEKENQIRPKDDPRRVFKSDYLQRKWEKFWSESKIDMWWEDTGPLPPFKDVDFGFIGKKMKFNPSPEEVRAWTKARFRNRANELKGFLGKSRFWEPPKWYMSSYAPKNLERARREMFSAHFGRDMLGLESGAGEGDNRGPGVYGPYPNIYPPPELTPKDYGHKKRGDIGKSIAGIGAIERRKKEAERKAKQAKDDDKPFKGSDIIGNPSFKRRPDTDFEASLRRDREKPVPVRKPKDESVNWYDQELGKKNILKEGIQDPNDPDSPLMRNDDDYVSDFTGIPWSEESVASEIERAKELDSDDHQYPQDKLSTAIKDVIDLVAEYEEEYSEDANAAMMELHAELDKKFGTEFLRFNVHPNQIKRSDDREAKQQNIKSMERSQLGFDETIKRWGKIIKE